MTMLGRIWSILSSIKMFFAPVVVAVFLYGLIQIYKTVKLDAPFYEYSKWFIIVVICITIMMAPFPM